MVSFTPNKCSHDTASSLDWQSSSKQELISTEVWVAEESMLGMFRNCVQMIECMGSKLNPRMKWLTKQLFKPSPKVSHLG